LKGIILAGGVATRLRPASLAVSKQLMPVYDKPLIYYPLTSLMLSGVREILLITSPNQLENFKELFKNSLNWGIDLSFAVQDSPNGIAASLLIGQKFLRGSCATVILGDNLFHGNGLGRSLQANFQDAGAQIFAYKVQNPSDFGVVEFEKNGKVKSIEEKPAQPKSQWAIPGLYLYDASASDRAKELKVSNRGELEITDLNNSYLKDDKLSVKILPRGTVWLDMGSPSSLLQASQYISTIQERQGVLVGSPEEAAWVMGWIDTEQLLKLSRSLGRSEYAKRLKQLPNLK
jgi:glucose-1-phosphate thymidylyltransferase